MTRETAVPIDWSHPHPDGKYPLSSCFERLHYHLCKISTLLNEPKICAPNDFPQLTLYNTLHSMVIVRRDFFFFRARFTSFHTRHIFFPSWPVFFILLHSCCSHALVFGKTLVHEFPIHCFFCDSATTSTIW